MKLTKTKNKAELQAYPNHVICFWKHDLNIWIVPPRKSTFPPPHTLMFIVCRKNEGNFLNFSKLNDAKRQTKLIFIKCLLLVFSLKQNKTPPLQKPLLDLRFEPDQCLKSQTAKKYIRKISTSNVDIMINIFSQSDYTGSIFWWA